MEYIQDDIPKYKKKSQQQAPLKSKHKHTYAECITWWNDEKLILGKQTIREWKSTYCTSCGKIGSLSFITYPVDNTLQLTPEALKMKEHDEKLPHFEINGINDKYVPLTKSKQILSIEEYKAACDKQKMFYPEYFEDD